MSFIKLTRWDGEETYFVDFSAGMMLVMNDDGTTECRSPRAYSFKETPDQIFAAIGAAEAPSPALIEEARDHLAAALKQALPEDDQIIVSHMREAHALLRAALKARRS